MSDLKERVSYLQGLVDGLDITDATKEGKAITVIAGILKEMAEAITDIALTQEDIQDYIDCIDDDLADLEDEVYSEDFVSIDCPNCGEAIEVDASILDESDVGIICPECGEEFTPDEVSWDLCHCDFQDDYDYDDDDDDGFEDDDEE
ncbi:MAG: CD1247 N-terminal domain-containing protein [Bacillota bacterium]